MTINQTMNISRESMNNYQHALAVVSQNLANMNVDGYIKLRADFATNPTYSLGNNVYSNIRGLNGASISQITSYANNAAANSARGANSQAQYYYTLGSIMDQLGEISNELGDDGLQASFEEFFSAAQNLSANPTDPSARRIYLESAQSVAMKFNSIAGSLDNLQEQLVGDWQHPATIENSDIYMSVQDFNKGLERLAELNKQITIQGAENSTGLINERENLLKDLSAYMDLNVEYNKNGTVDVKTGDIKLVAGGEQQVKLNAVAGDKDTPAIIEIQKMDGTTMISNANDEISGGQIGAILDIVNTSDDGFITISGMRSKIDEMANTFATEVNNVQTFVNGDMQAMALGTDPATGEQILVPSTEPIFNLDNPITADSISVNRNVIDNPNLIATARVDTSVAGWEKNVGNSDNIVATAQLRDKNTMSTYGGANNVTFEGFLTYFSGEVGLQQSDIAGKFETANVVNESAQTNYQSITGVNLDEELADMIKFQRGYEASARMFNVANEIYQVLVALGE
ncbi:TPA: flagellar hook-associated protein FlgK [Candidatus Galligastranaerophilus faecipullorum]|nr:flagellar hook-associated protein FlgK [Candidatus Galligastranaerophilus faecipullorum]